jgi:hypothetical protein
MPAIDISQLARLDEVDAPTRRGPEQRSSVRAPGSASASATTMPPDAFAPPPDAFAPPPEAGQDEVQELEVERSTRAIRIASQFRSAQMAIPPVVSPPPPGASPRSPIRGVVIAIAFAVVVAAVIGLLLIACHRP